MIKLIAFDLDNTLAELGKGIAAKDIELLKEIEARGVRIAVCSGKPTYYLCGFMRQVGLRHPILVGENGSVIQFGVDLPPKEFFVLPYSEDAKKSLVFLKERLDEILPDLWYQPNLTELTPFPKSEADLDLIAECIEKNSAYIKDVNAYRFSDCFDIVPNGLSKSVGLEYLCKLLGVSRSEIVAVGDGVNDYPMFEYAGYSVGVRVADETRVDRNFTSANEALIHMLDLIE